MLPTSSMLRACSCVLTFGLMMPAVSVRAGVITTADGNGADAFVRGTGTWNHYADTNFGNADTVKIKHIGNLGDCRKAYLRFDLSGVSSEVLAATLKLTLDGGTTEGFSYNVYGLLDGHPGENWVEGDGGSDNSPLGELTWNNAPANFTTWGNGVIDSETWDLGYYSVAANTSAGTVVNFSGNNLLSFLNADTNDLATFLITRRGPYSQRLGNQIRTKENTLGAPPTLDLTLAPVPEPSTFLIWSIVGLVGIAWYRKRQRR